MNPIDNFHDRCGIITVCLIDPLSQLISKIMGLNEDEPNAVGFYYEADIYGVNKFTVILFNIYDNAPIPWLRLGYTMDLLLASPFVTRISFYPIINSKSNESGPLLNRNTIGGKYKKFEDAFKTVAIETIGINASSIHDNSISYTILLLKMAGIADYSVEGLNQLTYKLITGYSLVNRVLLILMGIKQSDANKTASSIISCPLLKQSVSFVAPRENINETDIKYVIEESRREITKLVAIFADLFTSDTRFRNNILLLRSNRLDKSVASSKLFSIENELVTYIVDGFHNGIISNETFNRIIKELNNERLGVSELPMSIKPAKEVKIINDVIMCTFQSKNHKSSNVSYNMESLRDLGIYLSHIVESFNNPESMIINLDNIVNSYNNIVDGLDLPNLPIIPNIRKGHTTSRNAIITISENPIGSIPINQNILIPMSNGNLKSIDDDELLDTLVYIDSLRNSNGNGDTKFIHLQNAITHELASRKRSNESNGSRFNRANSKSSGNS